MTRCIPRQNRTLMGTLGVLVALLLAAPVVMAQDNTLDDYEYEADEGLHEEEWYDPSDWFESDNDGIDYEYDYDPYYTDYDYYGESGYDYDPYRYDWYAVYYEYDRPNRDRGQERAQSDRRKRDQRNREGYAQGSRRSSSDRARGHQQARTAQFGHHFTGDLVKTKTVNMFGDQHVLAKIRKSNGKTCLVDLGPKKKIAKLDLQKGDTLRIDGRRGMLAAGRVRANDETVTIDRQWAGDRGMHPYRTQGKIDNLRTRVVDGEKKLIAYLEGPDGWLQRVNLGSKQHLKDEGFTLEEGDHIKVHGHRGHVSGTAMVFANRIRTMDESRHSRSRDRQGRQQRFSGEVTDTWTEWRDDDRHMFVTIELDNGKSVDVALGEKDELARFDINEGDEIRVRGTKKRDHNGEMCVVASRLRVNGGSWKSLD